MSNTPRPTRNEQREEARAKAKEMRLAQKRNATRKRTILIASIVAVVAVAVTGVVLTIKNEVNNPVPTAATPANMAFDGGIKIGKGLKAITNPTEQADTPNIIVYEDLQCPVCKAFEVPNMPQISELVKAGKYNLEVHPISFLDGASVNEYSSRAGSALLCVADSSPSSFMAYNSALYGQQPAENSAGPDNNALASLAKSVGVTSQKTLDCITNADWANWAKNATPAYKSVIPGSKLQFTGTPFIMVNGQQYQGDLANAAMFLQWLQTVAPVSTN